MRSSLAHRRGFRTDPGCGAGRLRAMEFVLIAIAILLVGLVLGVSLLVGRGRRTTRLDDDATAGTTLTRDRKSTRLNSSHANISYAVFCLKKKKKISITDVYTAQY